MGVEPIITAWKAVVLPLHYCCMELLRRFELPTPRLQGERSTVELQEHWLWRQDSNLRMYESKS